MSRGGEIWKMFFQGGMANDVQIIHLGERGNP